MARLSLAKLERHLMGAADILRTQGLDAVADAVQDDDEVGPALDPFEHKLVKSVMADYLEQIQTAKLEIARLKGEQESFEQSNAPDDADEDEQASWNYARDIERRLRELKTENSDALKRLKKLEREAEMKKASDEEKSAARRARNAMQSFFDDMAGLEAELEPYKVIKADLALARARHRELMSYFVAELKSRCGGMSADEKRSLVLELMIADLQGGLDAVLSALRHSLAAHFMKLRDKYCVPLDALQQNRDNHTAELTAILDRLGYSGGNG